jgi:hypothetical protein
LLLSFSALLLLAGESSAFAQSAIVNSPSTDVVSAKQVNVEMDFITNYAWQTRDERFVNYLPRAVIGVGGNVEVGVNFSYTHVPDGAEPFELQPNFKWQLYQNESRGVAAAAGCLWFIPVRHRTGTDTMAQCYSVVSKQISGDYGPRFTGGGYVLVGAGDGERNKSGVIAAYEQPLTKNVQFIIDWASGENRVGYVAPAINIDLPRNGYLSGGYAIANKGRGRNWLFLYYGTQF